MLFDINCRTFSGKYVLGDISLLFNDEKAKEMIMSLKTATLIALIGVAVHFVLSFIFMFNPQLMAHYYSGRGFRVLLMFNLVILDVSIALFLAILYSKQK